MSAIPVTFEFKGVEYSGVLKPISGGGGTNSHFHLMIGNRYLGQLFHTDNYGWRFHGNVEGMEELSEYFGNIVELWFE